MIRRQELSSPRGGFTLIELLVVIAIIAVLVSLTTAGVMQVMRKIPETRTRTEIAQLETALQSFSNDHNGVPLPSQLRFYETGAYPANDPLGQQTLRFLRKAFGKSLGIGSNPSGWIDWNQNGQVDPNPITLTGSQCLVFYLGGPGGTQGFSNNNNNPLIAAGTPYYPFVTSRLVADPYAVANNSANAMPTTGLPVFPVYIDGYAVKGPPAGYSNTNGYPFPKPYAYFSANGVQNGYNAGDCASIGAVPWADPTANLFINPSTYQVLSAGRDGVFGTSGQWSATNGTLDVYGKDDQANFSQRLLMAGAQ